MSGERKIRKQDRWVVLLLSDCGLNEKLTRGASEAKDLFHISPIYQVLSIIIFLELLTLAYDGGK